MNIKVRGYEEKDLSAMIRIWNEVVEDGEAFPQEEVLTTETGRDFFRGADVQRSSRGCRNRRNLRTLYPASEQCRTMRSYL